MEEKEVMVSKSGTKYWKRGCAESTEKTEKKPFEFVKISSEEVDKKIREAFERKLKLAEYLSKKSEIYKGIPLFDTTGEGNRIRRKRERDFYNNIPPELLGGKSYWEYIKENRKKD